MLVVSRKVGEEIVIAEKVKVRIVAIGGKRVRLAIAAPKSVSIHREEVHRRNLAFHQPVDVPLVQPVS